MYVVIPTALPVTLSTTANGSIEPFACNESRRSISAPIFSGSGMVVYHSCHSPPSFTASIRSSRWLCASGSRVARELRKVTG